MDLKFLENFKAIKLGQGVVSKNLGAFAIYESALTAFLFATHNDLFHIIDLVLMALGLPIYFFMNVFMINRFPAHALLEGAQFVDYYRAQQGMLGRPDVVDALPHVTNPERPDPIKLTGDVE